MALNKDQIEGQLCVKVVGSNIKVCKMQLPAGRVVQVTRSILMSSLDPMEVFPSDDPPPNEVGSGPTVSQPDPDWDESFASLEIALQAVCETKDTPLETSDVKDASDLNEVKTEVKRKWEDDDSFEDFNKPKLKRINNMLLGSGEVTIQLVGQTNENCDKIPISDILSIMKSEPETKLKEFDIPTDTMVKKELEFIKLEPKQENSNFKNEIECKHELSENKDISLKEEPYPPDEKDFDNNSEITLSRDIKSDSGFTDDLSMESKVGFFSPGDNILCYDLKGPDEKPPCFKSENDSEPTLPTNESEIPQTNNLECSTLDVKEEKTLPDDNMSNLDETCDIKRENNEEGDKSAKKDDSDKTSKKDDKLLKKKKFERCNIRDIKLDDELDAVTLSAQKEEQERIQRLQEAQMRALQERLQQIEVEKEALSQLFSQPNDDAQNLFDSSMSEPETSDECKVPIKNEKDVVLVESSDEDKKAKLQNLIPSPIEENIIDISSSSSGNDSDSEDSDKKDDDVMVLSDEGETEGESSTAEDPNNSGAHTNDCFNLPDEEGRVLVNVGHPPEDPDIFLAPQIAKVIKPHQIGGIRFLYDNVVENLERYKSSSGFGCILAHSMGLGKTVQVVSFVDVFLRHTPATLVLCIVPINTIQNWKAEFDMWVPPSNCVEDAQVLSGEIRPRDCNIYTLNENFKTMATRAGLIAEWRKEGGVLLMGYEMYRMLALRKMPKIPMKKSKRLKKQEMAVEPETNEQIKKYMDEMYEHIVIPGPDLVICDEGHRIKNSLASTSMALKSIKTRRRVVLTGYPLQNNLLEYWCMVDFVRPNYLGSRAEFCNMFERPISNGQCIDSTPRDRQLMRFRSHVLHSLLVGFVQRRGHSVLRAVLPKKEEHVLLIRMTPIQRQLYKCFVKDLLYVQQATNPLKLFAVCCKIWNHPDILYKLLQEKKAQEDIDLDIDITMASSSASTCGKKKGISQAKSKMLQRPLRALPRNLKPQTCTSEEIKSEASSELETITASEDANFNSSDICKEEFNTSNQVGLSAQKDYSQTYQSQYSSNNSNQQFCQQNYQVPSGQQYNSSTAHYLPQSNMNQTQFPSQASPQPVAQQQYPQSSLMQQQYGQSQNQYPQGNTQTFSQVNSPFGSQTNLQQEAIPSSKSNFQGKSSQSYSSSANSLQYSTQTDAQKQYQQNIPQAQFKNQSSNSQEAHFSPPSNPQFTQQTPPYPNSPASHQSYSPQSSKYSQQQYPPSSKHYSEQQFTSQTESRSSSQFISPQSYAQMPNPQSHTSEQASTHNFSSQSTHQMSPPQSQFSQNQSTQQFSQQSIPLASSQFPSQGSFSQMSQSEHFPPQTTAQQPSSTQTFSQSSPNQQIYSQAFPQQSSEFPQPSPSPQQFQKQTMQPFSQHKPTQPQFNSAHQSFSDATQMQSSPLQQKFPQQAASQPFLSHEQQYSEPSSKQFSQNSEQPNFSPSQSFTHQSLQSTKFDSNQGLSFPQQTSGGKVSFSQSSPQANTQKPGSQSPPEESSQQQNFTQAFSSETSTDSQFSQQSGSFCHQSSQSFPQQSSQLSPSFNTSQISSKVQQYIQSTSNASQYNQPTTKSDQSYNQQTSEQFSQSENQSSQQYNSQPQSSQYNQQMNQSPQYSQHATSQQFPQQSSKPQFGQATQNQLFSQHSKPSQFSHNTQNHKYPQQLPQAASQQFNQQSQYPQQPQLSQQYSTQTPQSQQYAQSPSQSPQFLQDQSPQQYTQQPTVTPHQSGHFSTTNTHQRFSQPASQSSPEFNQQPIQSSAFNQQQSQQTESFNQSSQQYNQSANHPSQQYNHISGPNSQFNQQGNQCQQFSQQSNSSNQIYNQQLNSNSAYKQQLQTSQQYDAQTSQPPQQYNSSNQSNQPYDQISGQSAQYASKPIQTSQPYSQQSSQQYPHQQQCQPTQYSQQPTQSSQQFSQPVPSPQQYVQQPLQSPQQFTQSGQSPQQFTQPVQSPQQFTQPVQSPQQFTQPVQSPQQFTQPVQSPQQFSHQTTPSPQQFIQQPSVSPQQFSQQNIQSPQEFVQSAQQYPQPNAQQQYKQQALPPGQSSQFSLPHNVASQPFSNSFPQASNDSGQGSFQVEYQSQIQPNLPVMSQQGLSPQSVNQQAKPNVKGTKPKQGRSKLCQNLLPQNSAQHSQVSLKQPPSFSAQGFQNGSPTSNSSQRPVGQHTVKQGSVTNFQPLNSPVSHQDTFNLQPIKQDTPGTFPSKCSKAVLQGQQQINNPDTSSVQQLPQNTMKSESVSLESDQQSNTCTDATVMPFRDRMDSSISYEWAIPIMKEYVLGVLENSHKMMVLFVIIAETLHMGDKLLVFSQSLSTLDLLEHFLSKIQVPRKPDQSEQFPNETWCRNKNYFRLDGSTSAQEREKLINEFNRNDNVSLFLLSTRAGCLGINLVGANRIVVMDASWNPCHDAQAVCRIYRYGQKKQCHIYRLVTDNSLEKRIYDRQVNKQGMSDRVVDELNPESNFTWKDVTTLIQDDEDDGPIQELSKFASSYSDKVLKYLVQEMSPSLSKEPFEHESLLLDRKDLKLTKQEKRLAKQSYEMAKRANMINIRTTYTYLPAGTAGGGQIIINNKQCQWVGGTTIRVLPNQSTSSGGNVRPGGTATPITASPSLMSSLFKQGVMVQKLTMPSNVSIPVLTPGAPPVVIPAGQDVLVLRTPKGVYLRLPDGRIIAVQLPPSLLAKTQFRPNVVTHFRPAAPKGGNQPSTVINTPRGQSIGIIKQTLQCGGTVRYLGPRNASGSTSQNSARSSAPEVIDLSDDDEPLVRKSASASNASTNSSESDSGSMDQDKFENILQPTMLPGKQITIRKISPNSPQNVISLSSSKEKCEIPQVLSKNKQITIMPINPTSQQSRQKFTPQLAQPVRVQQMLLQPQQGKKRPFQKSTPKVQIMPANSGKNMRPQVTVSQPTTVHSLKSSQTSIQQKNIDPVENTCELRNSSPTKYSEDSFTVSSDRDPTLNVVSPLQSVSQILQNSKSISISLSEPSKTNAATIPDSLASLANKLNPNLQISPVEQPASSDLVQSKNAFHFNSSMHTVSSSSLQNQITNTVQSSLQSNKTELPTQQSTYALKSSPSESQSSFSNSQASSLPSPMSNKMENSDQSFQHPSTLQTSLHQMQQKALNEQQSVEYTSQTSASQNPQLTISPHQPQAAPQDQQLGSRKKKSTNKLASKKSEHSLITQNHPLQSQVQESPQFSHPQISDHHPPENQFSSFSRLSGSDFPAFSNFSSPKLASHIQHPQPLHPLQHSQEHALPPHLQHMSRMYPHLAGNSPLTDMQPMAPRAWPVPQPTVSSFHPFSQSSSFYSSGQDSQFSFQPNSLSLSSSSKQTEPNINSGSEGDKTSHFNLSNL